MASRSHPHIVILAVEIDLIVDEGFAIADPLVGPSVIGLGLTILRMEINCARGKGMRVRPIVNIEVERVDRLLAFIGYCDARMLGERHGEKAVECFDAADREIL